MKINIKDLTPNAQEIIVTHKIGDISVREYIKLQNLRDKMAVLIIEGYNEDNLEEWLCEGIFDYLGHLDQYDYDYCLVRAKEIMALIYEDAKTEADERNKLAAEALDEQKQSYNELVGGNR